MTTVCPCYAEEDRSFVEDLAQFLEQGAEVRVFLEEGAIGPGENIVGKARDGRIADVVVVIFSPASIPLTWVRSDWEEAFVTGPASEGVQMAFLLRSECRFPEVLRREAFFESRRALKRWIRTGERRQAPTPPNLEELTAALGDRPGSATSALANEFVEHCRGDFEEVFWIRCGGRTLAQLAGDLGFQLGLRLEGEPLENAARIRRFCEERRLLIVFEDARTPHILELSPGGLTSTLITETPVRDFQPGGLEQIEQQFALALGEDDWGLACSLARRGWALAHEGGRLAEAFEIAESLHAAARGREDLKTLESAIREQIWILEHWDRLDEADSLRRELGVPGALQLAFQF